MLYGERYIPDWLRLTGKPLTDAERAAVRRKRVRVLIPYHTLEDGVRWAGRVSSGEAVRDIAATEGVTHKTVRKWVKRAEALE